MSKNKNPLKGLADFYTQSVQEADKKGYADLYKAATEKIFEEINSQIKNEKTWNKRIKVDAFNFIDVNYGDGYYIFGMGTNSVVNFHIAEIPGWLFGIWWSTPEEKINDNGEKYSVLRCNFFVQFEKNIDKFKPSASNLALNLSINCCGDKMYMSVYSITNLLNFMHNEPELAFCRDYCGWDYNEEYHSREEACKKYNDYLIHKKNEEEFTASNDATILKFVKDKILPRFSGAEIIDRGECWSPRYDICAPAEDNGIAQEGCYDWFEDDDADGQKIVEEYESLIKKCEDISDKYEFIWFSPIHTSINFYKSKKKK